MDNKTFEENEVISETKYRKDGKSSVLREIVSYLIYIAVMLAVTYIVIHYVGQRTQVSGESMESTLQDGDNLIVDKISYRFRDPERYDIIVFPFQYDDDTYYIKRIIGLPGERVYIDENGAIFVNDDLLDESYGREVIDPQHRGLAVEEITLADDEYFVMGDNRNESSDSRDPNVGNIKKDDIIGRAWVRIYPFDNMGFIRHK
jgi:signal peptidase I